LTATHLDGSNQTMTATLVRDLVRDLGAESASLDAMVAPLPPDKWATPTPAIGWTIAHQIAHLAWTDRLVLMSVTDEEAFRAQLTEAIKDPAGFTEAGAQELATEEPAKLLTRWRDGLVQLAEAIAHLPGGTHLAWFGPGMSAASMASARIMETWAHGQDVADALGVTREPTQRLRHVAHIAVAARGYAYAMNGMEPPDVPIRVELVAPDGATWTWGPADAPERVTGPALDFCLLATQRRHRNDLAVTARGPNADRWLDIAQAFAGPPGPGRQPGQFSHATAQR
jgi:uncharacterized protein (TIGR03084 family)